MTILVWVDFGLWRPGTWLWAALDMWVLPSNFRLRAMWRWRDMRAVLPAGRRVCGSESDPCWSTADVASLIAPTYLFSRRLGLCLAARTASLKRCWLVFFIFVFLLILIWSHLIDFLVIIFWIYIYFRTGLIILWFNLDRIFFINVFCGLVYLFVARM